MRLKIVTKNIYEKIAKILNLVPEPIIDTQVAFIAARSVIAAADLGLFEALGRSQKTSDEISTMINTHPHATRNLLNCLVGIKYIRWENEKYSIRPKYYKWLLKEYPTNLIGKLRFQKSEWNWMSQLEEYVQNGRSIDIHSVMSKNEWIHYQEGMRSLSISTAKELANKMSLPQNATQMLDIGGSHGLYSIELCKKNPLLNSTILELPEAIDMNNRLAEQYDLTGRLNFIACNVLDSDLGEKKYDIIMVNNVVHHFTKEENIILTNKIARALKPGGICAIGELIRLEKPLSGEMAASSAGLYFALTSSSGTWSLKEIASWQNEAGLKNSKALSLITFPGWKMSIARK
jgi:2-polyprenyl-3-methyl-5-hydroxy-6-metoxy-1,4-benzoquinol methylase